MFIDPMPPNVLTPPLTAIQLRQELYVRIGAPGNEVFRDDGRHFTPKGVSTTNAPVSINISLLKE
jgi:hypothetical protein